MLCHFFNYLYFKYLDVLICYFLVKRTHSRIQNDGAAAFPHIQTSDIKRLIVVFTYLCSTFCAID